MRIMKAMPVLVGAVALVACGGDDPPAPASDLASNAANPNGAGDATTSGTDSVESGADGSDAANASGEGAAPAADDGSAQGGGAEPESDASGAEVETNVENLQPADEAAMAGDDAMDADPVADGDQTSDGSDPTDEGQPNEEADPGSAVDAIAIAQMERTTAAPSGWENFAGTATWSQVGDEVTVVVEVTGCPDGAHISHVHANGNCGPDGESAGLHWVPNGEVFDNMACSDGVGSLSHTESTSVWTIGGDPSTDVTLHAYMIHALSDAQGAGARAACGSIVEQ